MQHKKRQIRNLLIEPEFQLKVISYFGLVFVLTTVSLYSTVLLFFWRLRLKALSVGIPPGHVFFKFVSNEKADLDLAFLGLAFFNFLLLLGVGFVVSHRIAGPIHKLKRHLGEFGPSSPDFKLRKNDLLRDLEPVVNDVRGRLK